MHERRENSLTYIGAGLGDRVPLKTRSQRCKEV